MKKLFSIFVAVILIFSLSAPVLSNTRMCNGCAGQGRSVCHICRGTGVERQLVRDGAVTGRMSVEERARGGVREIPCRACSGGGGRTCAVCRGSGQIPGGASSQGGNQGGNQGRATAPVPSATATFHGTSIRTFGSVTQMRPDKSGAYVFGRGNRGAVSSYRAYLRDTLGLTESVSSSGHRNDYTFTRGSTQVIRIIEEYDPSKKMNNNMRILVTPNRDAAGKFFPPAPAQQAQRPAAQQTQRPANQQQAQRPAQQAQRPAQQAQRPQAQQPAQQAQRPPAQQAQRPAAQQAQKPAAQSALQAAPQRILTQPQAQTVKQGHMAIFTVAMLSPSSSSYQWQMRRKGEKDFAPIPETERTKGTTRKATLSLRNTQAAEDGAQIRCVIRDKSGSSITTNPVTLTVTRP